MKITDISGTARLSNGIKMPYFGLGVFNAAEGNETIRAIHWALEAGYRHIDTASLYGNEKSVGEAVNTAAIPRDELFITTKVWNSDQGYKACLEAFNRSLERLDMSYVDLYLVHWPVKEKYLETWEALEDIYAKKLTRAIGVSNFKTHHLEDLISRNGIPPMINQVEYHPFLGQPELMKYCGEHDIRMQAWSPIMKGRVNDIALLQELGKKYHKSAVQITLRWDLQKGVITIPKSVNRERIVGNADIFDFELTKEEIRAIDSLDRKHRLGADPDNFAF